MMLRLSLFDQWKTTASPQDPIAHGDGLTILAHLQIEVRPSLSRPAWRGTGTRLIISF